MPGSSDRFIAKARGLAVDALFLDLEDAVAPAVKAESRARIVDALNDPAGFAAPTVTVRVNSWDTPWTYADVIEVVSGAGARKRRAALRQRGRTAARRMRHIAATRGASR